MELFQGFQKKPTAVQKRIKSGSQIIPSFEWIAFQTITIYGNSILAGTSFGFTKAKITCESSKIPSNLQLSDVKNTIAIKAMNFVQAPRNFFCQKRPPNDCILKYLRCHSPHFEAVIRKLSIRSRLVAILEHVHTFILLLLSCWKRLCI